MLFIASTRICADYGVFLATQHNTHTRATQEKESNTIASGDDDDDGAVVVCMHFAFHSSGMQQIIAAIKDKRKVLY